LFITSVLSISFELTESTGFVLVVAIMESRIIAQFALKGAKFEFSEVTGLMTTRTRSG